MADAVEAAGKEEVLARVLAPEEVERKALQRKQADAESWTPRTEVGRKVKRGEVDLDSLLDSGTRILEPEIADFFLPNMSSELLMIGQAKGKFGGGQRRVFRQTQKKTREGNKPNFATCVVVGNGNGIVGIGYGKSKETVPAREKAMRNAKLSIIKVRRGCGSWQCGCGEGHSLPFKVFGKCGSVRLELIPAPKGTGLVAEQECRKILAMAGVRDVWSRALGQARTKLNLIRACEDALKRLSEMKTPDMRN